MAPTPQVPKQDIGSVVLGSPMQSTTQLHCVSFSQASSWLQQFIFAQAMQTSSPPSGVQIIEFPPPPPAPVVVLLALLEELVVALPPALVVPIPPPEPPAAAVDALLEVLVVAEELVSGSSLLQAATTTRPRAKNEARR